MLYKTIHFVPVPNLKLIESMKTELWAKEFRGSYMAKWVFFCPPTWLLQYYYSFQISVPLSQTKFISGTKVPFNDRIACLPCCHGKYCFLGNRENLITHSSKLDKGSISYKDQLRQ